MGEGHWVEVRVTPDREVDGARCVKALQQLRKELAAEGLPTQDVVAESGDDESVAIAVALVGGAEAAQTLVDVLRDWIHRRKNPARAVLALAGDAIEVNRSIVDDQTRSLTMLLTGHH